MSESPRAVCFESELGKIDRESGKGLISSQGMYYVIDKEALYGRVDEEVSRVADEAYTDDGTSLYDTVLLTERDKEMVERYMDDAVSALVTRTFDICKYSPQVVYREDGQGNVTDEIDHIVPRLLFHVPDLDTGMEERTDENGELPPFISEELSRYIAYYTANAIFLSRRPGVVPQYADRVQAAMNRAVTLLKSRKAPNARW